MELGNSLNMIKTLFRGGCVRLTAAAYKILLRRNNFDEFLHFNFC